MDPRNDLAYWLPRLRHAGLPTPATDIVVMPGPVVEESLNVLDGKPSPGLERWVDGTLGVSADIIATHNGSPVFLRTGYTAGKHGWRDTCAVTDHAKLLDHVVALIEYSALADFRGLPWDTWAVREMLPTEPLAILPNYGDMPLCREWRCFVRGGELACRHPYWPDGAIADGINAYGIDRHAEGKRLAMRLAEETGTADVEALARAAGRALGGDWSVDILATKRGWYVTDCAVAAESWHWPGCPNEGWR